MKYFAETLIVLPFIVVLDLLWTTTLARPYYMEQLGPLLSSQIHILPIIAFYLFYASATARFCVGPALEQKSHHPAFWNGALLGLTAYGTYDLVNLGTTANWPYQVALVDMAWGVVLTSVCATAAYAVARKVLKR